MREGSTGQSLIEILLAVALAAILLPALLTGMVSARDGKAQQANRLRATHLLREAEEAVRSIRAANWAEVDTTGTFYPNVVGSAWDLESGSETIGFFTRSIILAEVFRNNSGAVVTTGGINDPSTKKVTVSVSWAQPFPQTVTSTFYISRYKANATLLQTTQAEFDSGTHNQTRSTNNGGGTVELKPGTGSLTFVDDYSVSANYSFDASKVEVTGGFAQLKSQGTPTSGSTTNGSFDSLLSGWTFSRFERNVLQTGTAQVTGGNPGAFAQINFPANRNKVAGGYLYQAFTTTAANPVSTLTFQWSVPAYQATPNGFKLYAFVDSGSGAPVLANAVWSSPTITSTNAWSGTVTVDVSAKTINPGTYYLKIASVVDYGSTTKGPFTVGFDNVVLSWSGTSASYPNTQQTVTPTTSFAPSSVASWDSFSTVEVTNGGSIQYQLSNNDGVTWFYHGGGNATNWLPALTATNYNPASIINQKISGFPTVTGKIRVRAFLIGNGTQQVKLDQVTIGYTGVSGSTNGTFTSSSLDAGSEVSFNQLLWNATNTANTTTSLQVAVNSDNASWNYVGPDGTNSTMFTGGNGAIPLPIVAGRYLRYKIFFTSTTNDLPSVSEVTVNYSP